MRLYFAFTRIPIDSSILPLHLELHQHRQPLGHPPRWYQQEKLFRLHLLFVPPNPKELLPMCVELTKPPVMLLIKGSKN